jgi:hypothetical protein
LGGKRACTLVAGTQDVALDRAAKGIGLFYCNFRIFRPSNKHHQVVTAAYYINIFFFFSRLYNPSGFRPAQLALSILSRKVLQSAVASGTSNPQLGGEPGI